jgi:hypothetical protein
MDGYGLDVEGLDYRQEQNFFLTYATQTVSGYHPYQIQLGVGPSSLGGKAARARSWSLISFMA